MSHEISAADLLAFGDVLDLIDNEASPTDGTPSGMSVERAAELLATCEALRKRLGDTEALLKSAAIRQLEGQPKLVGTKVFSRKPDRKKRPNHERIRAAVIGHSLHNADGEQTTPVEAASMAYQLTMALFVADSTVPKVAGLKAVELSDKDAFEWETTGYSLKVTDLGDGE